MIDMNKTALKNFATKARRELLKKVEAKALKIGISEENIKKAQFESSDAIYIDGKQLTITEKKQRDKLIQRINEIGFKQVVEEVAYTWFNRFVALRFMEVNNYLPTKVRVLSSSNPDSPEPDILKEALSVDLDIDKELVYELKLNNKTEELYKYLIIKQCNSLNKYLPFLFETIEDYKEILFPEGLLAKDSFLREMTDTDKIPESDWEQVEIIGWLYQFYISEKKDQVFADLKKNIKISKENIPAATQLFTPHWIVRYMVENSLGRIWLESYPNSSLKSEWKYYLDEAEQEEEVKKKLEEIRYKNVNPEDITFLDPCCGSGHILVYAFDVFYDMYLEKGYIQHEIPKLILEKNLFGLDIDDRAVQLASFALMMKAREKSRRIFWQGIKLNISAIQESNWMTDEIIEVLVDKKALELDQSRQRETLKYIRDTFKDAKEYGSILDVKPIDLNFLDRQLGEFSNDYEDQGDITERIAKAEILEKMPGILFQARILSNNYDVVCTNPPYMGSSGMEVKLSGFVKKNYSDSKSDLFAVFIERCSKMVKENGFQAMITQHVWMFLSSFEKLRAKIMDSDIVNMAHLGARAFEEIGGEVVQTAAFVLRNRNINDYKSTYVRLVDYDNAKIKEEMFLQVENRFVTKKECFLKIPGSPIAYWASKNLLDVFGKYHPISFYGKPCKGIDTGNNNRFLKLWYEIEIQKLGKGFKDYTEAINSNYSYYPYNKGGDFRKWYGNNEYVIWWHENGRELREFSGSNLRNKEYYRKDGLTWSTVTSGNFSIREFGYGFYFDNGGSCLFIGNKRYFMALLNSKVMFAIQKMFPTLNYQPGEIGRVPAIVSDEYNDQIVELASICVNIAKEDWDNYETSWDFKAHPIMAYKNNATTIQDAFNNWLEYSNKQFATMKSAEETINQIFINLYDLNNELTPEVDEKDVTISKADQNKDIKSFISYAVGCMFGRFSLDEEGLVFAGGKFEPERYQKYPVDMDNIIPVLSGAYFEDDIVSKFIEFVNVTFGEETLEENLEFIADTLGKKNGETARETIRRYFLNDFFKDHVQTYKKRPIYWLFTSGKQKAFNCLIYMHRYDKTTLSRIRTDYLHPLQIRLDAERKSLLEVIEGGGTAKEISNAKKELKQLDLKIDELKAYDEVLHHMADMQIEIDLDDGVAVNYAKFNGLLAKLD
jgi:Eco57I restriction-modification methylase